MTEISTHGTTGLAPSIVPSVMYDDAPAAIDWLGKAFGFEATMVVPGPEGTVAHSQLVHGNGMVMIGSRTRPDDDEAAYRKAARALGPVSIYVIVDDPDAHHARAVAGGADIVEGLADTDYGSRGYTARDPEGNLWTFGTYRPSLTAETSG